MASIGVCTAIGAGVVNGLSLIRCGASHTPTCRELESSGNRYCQISLLRSASLAYHEVVQILNQTSYLLLATVVLALVAFGVWRLGNWRGRLIIMGGVAVALLSAFLVLRSGASQAESLNEVVELTQGGVPVVVEVYSDF